MSIKPFVKQSGNGPALALIHGWGLHGGIWETILPRLEQQFTIYNIDLPGFGYSPVHNGDYTLDYLAESVAEILPEKCALLGWSLGGMVATKIALSHTQKVDKLITVASNPCFVAKTTSSASDSQNWPGMKPEVLASFIDYLEEDFEGTLIRFLGIQTMGSATQKADIKLLKDTVFIHGQPSKKALRGGLQILNNEDLSVDLHQLACPVFRLYGHLDALVPKKVAAAVEQLLPESESKTYRKSAHAPFLSHGEEFVNDICRFLCGEGASVEAPSFKEKAQ